VTFKVVSDRLPWAAGAVIDGGVLAGCNIGALVEGGHLKPVPDKTIHKQSPAKPVETADEPKEL